MSEHTATVDWKRTTDSFTYETYNRDHVWRFDGGAEIPASATPAYLGSASCVDPEEAYIASLSSCHMLTFLALACKKRFIVERYVDEAAGYVEKNAEGKQAVTRVVLRPYVVFSGEKQPNAADLTALHHSAHEYCFIAASVKTTIAIEPRESA